MRKVEYKGKPGEITDVIEDGVKVSCIEKCGSVESTWWEMDENIYPFWHSFESVPGKISKTGISCCGYGQCLGWYQCYMGNKTDKLIDKILCDCVFKVILKLVKLSD